VELPAGLPAAARESALRTVAEAQDVAAALPSPELASAAAHAFTTGVRWTSLMGAVVLAVVAACATVLLRRRAPAPVVPSTPDASRV
jgi:DHA2 family multidrug resistance protein-like MFS transporter